MDEQGILDLLLSSQPENIALAKQLLIGAGIPLIQLLDKFGYSQIGVTNFFWFEKTDWSIGNLTTETIPKLPNSVETLILWGMKVNRFCLRNECNLERLDCDNNQLSKLDVQGCVALKYLYCYNNQLRTLNLQGCVALEYLCCYSNQLCKLNVQGCVALKRLSCDKNQLSELNVQDCGNLELLYCDNNQLSELNVQGCGNLELLDCDNNQLSELNVQGCGNLELLDCDEKTKILNAPNSCEIHFYN